MTTNIIGFVPTDDMDLSLVTKYGPPTKDSYVIPMPVGCKK